METQTARNKNRLVPIMLGVICVVLIITVLLQYRYNTELKKELNEITLAERTQPELKAINFPSVINDETEKKIKKLESQIEDMQVWQDYLEDSLQNKENEKDIRVINNEMLSNNFMIFLSSHIDDVVKVTNLPSDIKKQLLDILAEIEIEIRELFSEDIPGEDKAKEMKIVLQKLDDQISGLIPEKYSEYKQHQKVQEEKNYIADFTNSMLTGGDQLDENQEEQLITAIYNENQKVKEIQKENSTGEDKWTIEKIKAGLEIQKMLHSSYIDSARYILSESQLQKFIKYLDALMLKQEIDTNRNISQIADREKKTGQ